MIASINYSLGGDSEMVHFKSTELSRLFTFFLYHIRGKLSTHTIEIDGSQDFYVAIDSKNKKPIISTRRDDQRYCYEASELFSRFEDTGLHISLIPGKKEDSNGAISKSETAAADSTGSV